MKKIVYLSIFLFVFFITPSYTFAITSGTVVDTVTLSKCVDGDTARFMKNANEIKVRFLAINTPESVHPTKEAEELGKESSEYTCQLLTNAKKIQLEYDPKSDETDKYGRVLAWVYVDGKLLQELLVQEGYAEVSYVYDDYLYVDKLKDVQQTAKDEEKGVWGIDREEKDITEQVSNTNTDTVNEDQGIIQMLIDKLFNFLNEIFEKFLKTLDTIIEDML